MKLKLIAISFLSLKLLASDHQSFLSLELLASGYQFYTLPSQLALERIIANHAPKLNASVIAKSYAENNTFGLLLGRTLKYDFDKVTLDMSSLNPLVKAIIASSTPLPL